MLEWFIYRPRFYLDFQSEADMKQIIVIVITCSVSCYFFRYAHLRYVKSLFTNIQEQ